MKSITEIVENCPKGFVARSAADAYNKGLQMGVRAVYQELKDVVDVLDIEITEELTAAEMVQEVMLIKDREIALLRLL
ncbi:hypothetical protein DRN75_00950 [Nanoarchaeota archaeon]|nr:MAG: hypothetical protein DRN75_00950 [Nanoarchaeota archaeon]